VDAPPPSPPPALVAAAPGDVAPRSAREAELCARASRPDWLYLGALGALDVLAIGGGAALNLKESGNVVSLVWPLAIGVTWGATIGGAWLALPKCSPRWVGEPPPEGDVGDPWALATALALLGAATAPIVSAIVIGSDNLPRDWSNFDRGLHVVVAAVAGFGGALLPYWLAPRTWRAARELEHLRFGAGEGRGAWLGYSAAF
jgi:hypothetical protein